MQLLPLPKKVRLVFFHHDGQVAISKTGWYNQ